MWHWPIVALNSPEARPSGKNAVPVILLEPFSLGGDAQTAADIALDVQSGLQTAIASRSGVRISMPPAKDLKPTYLLNGRCRVSGEKCRLNLSIVVTANGETCWSTQIDGETTDTFGFIDDVIWQVGAAVRVQLNAHAGEAFAAEQDETLSGQQLLSKAAFLMNKYDPKKMTQALETMTSAFAKAPEHPMTLAMYSYTLMQRVPLAMERAENVDIENVLFLADQAVHFGPKVDYAFHNRARIRLWLKRDHGGCRQDANRALEINPGFHFANEDLALVALFGGEIASGIENLRSIIKQLPTHPTTPYRSSILSIGCAVDGDLDQALASATDAYERKPNVRLHALAYAAAASGTPSITGSRKFRDMVATHQLSVLDADRFPFSQERDKRTLAALLARSGLPK